MINDTKKSIIVKEMTCVPYTLHVHTNE